MHFGFLAPFPTFLPLQTRRQMHIIPDGRYLDINSIMPLLQTGFMKILPSTVEHNFGVMLESDMSMKQHVARTVGSCFRQLCLILPLPFEVAVAFLVTSQVDHCNSQLVGALGYLFDRLQSVLTATARLIWNWRRFDFITPLLCNVQHWLSVLRHVEFKLSKTHLQVTSW